MKKILLTLVAALAFPLMMSAQAQKIAIVDTQAVLTAMPETAAMQAELDALMKKYEDTLVVMREEFQKKYQEYIAEQETLLESIRTRREQEIQDLANRIDGLNQEAQQDLQKKQVELFTPIQTKIRNAITAVGNENGYTYILDASTVLFLNNSSAIDATPQLRAKLGI